MGVETELRERMKRSPLVPHNVFQHSSLFSIWCNAHTVT